MAFSGRDEVAATIVSPCRAIAAEGDTEGVWVAGAFVEDVSEGSVDASAAGSIAEVAESAGKSASISTIGRSATFGTSGGRSTGVEASVVASATAGNAADAGSGTATRKAPLTRPVTLSAACATSRPARLCATRTGGRWRRGTTERGPSLSAAGPRCPRRDRA